MIDRPRPPAAPKSPWSDFDINTALERDILGRALPLAATQSEGSARGVIDVAETTATSSISVEDNFGADPGRCLDVPGIRPLLVGTAWKVLDILLETALDEARVPPDKPNGFRDIASKARKAARTAPGARRSMLRRTFRHELPPNRQEPRNDDESLPGQLGCAAIPRPAIALTRDQRGIAGR